MGDIDKLYYTKDNGIYWVTAANASGNQPDIPHYYLIVMIRTAYSGMQLAFRHDGEIFKVRGYANGQWYEWRKFYTETEVNSLITPLKNSSNGIGKFSFANGSVNATAGVHTIIPVSVQGSNESGFQASGGKLKITEAGTYMVIARIDTKNVTMPENTYCDVHLYVKNTDFDAGETFFSTTYPTKTLTMCALCNKDDYIWVTAYSNVSHYWATAVYIYRIK